MYTLHREQFIPRPLAEVFPFFERPENLGRITPDWLNLVTLTPSPILMKEGAEIDYTIRLLGIRQRWKSRVTRYEPPVCFVDEQVRGPYEVWKHRYEFREEAGGTRVIDEVSYALPLGWLGRLVHAIYVRPALHAIFNFREKTIALLLS